MLLLVKENFVSGDGGVKMLLLVCVVGECVIVSVMRCEL